MYKRKLVIPTERSDEGSQKYRKIRDLSHMFEMTKYAKFLYKFLYRTHVKYKIEQTFIKGC